MTDLHPTRHAVEMMGERGVTWGDVVEACTHPSVVEPSRGMKRYIRGSLAVVVSPNNTVITVLLRETKQWNNTTAREQLGTQHAATE